MDCGAPDDEHEAGDGERDLEAHDAPGDALGHGIEQGGKGRDDGDQEDEMRETRRSCRRQQDGEGGQRRRGQAEGHAPPGSAPGRTDLLR